MILFADSLDLRPDVRSLGTDLPVAPPDLELTVAPCSL